MRPREAVVTNVGVDEEGGDDSAGGGEVFGQAVCENGGGGGGRGGEVVEHAVGVGDVDVEGVMPVPGAEGGDHDVEPAVGIVLVHGVVAHDEVCKNIVGKGGMEVRMRCYHCGVGLFSRYEEINGIDNK